MKKTQQETMRNSVAGVKRRQILDAAAAVFTERGFQRATMREIATRAGVATGTIYNHFDDKEALLRALMYRLNESDERSADLAAAASDQAAWLRHRLSVAAGELPALRVVLSEALVDPAFRKSYLDEVITPNFAAAGKAQRKKGKLKKEDAMKIRLLAATVTGLLVLRILGEQGTLAWWKSYPDLIAALFFPRPEHE
jgi:AcrR family transcriptional regulator